MVVGTAATMRRLFARYRGEGRGAAREAVAIGLGTFIGCLPVFGLHLPICLFLGWLLKLNRIKLYVAANVSNPFVLPFLLFVEIQAGSWLRRGEMHPVTVEALRAVPPWSFGVDLLIGAVAVGTGLGLALGGATYVALRTRRRDARFSTLVDRAADRYISGSVTAWEFAQAKLRSDPVYEAALCRGLLPSGGTLLDIGCGQGLMLVLLAEARRDRPVTAAPLPSFDRLIGIETRTRAARLARLALGDDGEVREGDATASPLPPFTAAIVFDVLHMLTAEQQGALLTAMRAAMQTGGVVLVREANPAAGWRFLLVRCTNRVKAVLGGAWHQPFTFRDTSAWLTLFRETGFAAEVHDDGSSGPLGNVLFRLAGA